MKKAISLTMIMLMLYLPISVCAFTVTDGSQTDADAVVDVIEAYYEASENEDINAYKNLFSEVLGTAVEFRASNTADLWTLYDVKLTALYVAEVAFDEDVALVDFVAEVEVSAEGEGSKQTSNRFIGTLFKESGEWKIVDIDTQENFRKTVDLARETESPEVQEMVQENLDMIIQEGEMARQQLIVIKDSLSDELKEELDMELNQILPEGTLDSSIVEPKKGEGFLSKLIKWIKSFFKSSGSNDDNQEVDDYKAPEKKVSSEPKEDPSQCGYYCKKYNKEYDWTLKFDGEYIEENYQKAAEKCDSRCAEGKSDEKYFKRNYDCLKAKFEPCMEKIKKVCDDEGEYKGSEWYCTKPTTMAAACHDECSSD